MARFAAALLSALLAGAAPALAAEVPTRTVLGESRFGQFEENYGIANRMNNKGWAGDDETALRAHYSFKYSVYGFGAADWLGRRQSELFLSYTGEFDFYAGTRPSGPVINRLSNPALHFRVCRECIADGRMKPAWDTAFDIGLEHRSDGQVTEVEDPQGAAAAQAAYAARNRAFFDQISRGSNYVSLTGYAGKPFGLAGTSVRARARIYISQNARVTWGPLAGTDTNVSDYDRLSLAWRQELGRIAGTPARLEADWTLGDRGLATDSLTLGLHFNVNQWLPLYVRVHVGPMNTLSNYTQRQDSIGVGLRFDQ